MIKARNISVIKLKIITFATLLPVNFLALVCTGWNEQGTMPNGFAVGASKVVLNILLFPMHIIESLFRTEPFADTLFFVFDVICLILWVLFLVKVYVFIVKRTHKPTSRKRM
jgi:hypothetical protein